MPHALFLKSQGGQFANIDIWGDFCSTFEPIMMQGIQEKLCISNLYNIIIKMARELTKTTNECNISTTCNQSKLPCRDAGHPIQTRKRADMMTLQGGCVQPNHHLNFSRSTLLIMDVTIGHIYNVHYSYKSGNLPQMEGSQRQK